MRCGIRKGGYVHLKITDARHTGHRRRSGSSNLITGRGHFHDTHTC
jgi:hypothetical protein